VLETDSVNVASKLTSEEKDRSMHGPLVEEIKKALRELDDQTVKWARRRGENGTDYFRPTDQRLTEGKNRFGRIVAGYGHGYG
jgi:hypothetical protein